jgi:hypothetical protein
MVSNLAKSIVLGLTYLMDKWLIKKIPPNLKFFADTLDISHFKNNDIHIKVINLFPNIKTLKVYSQSLCKISETDLKINLPRLQSLKINDSRLLKYFSRLQ